MEIYSDPETFTHVEQLVPLLEQIESDPDITQATLAERLNVAIGTVNWHLKRLVSKGYIKVKRAQRRKLRYIITPEGIALRARLTVNYIETTMELYRRTRLRVNEALVQVKQAGFDSVYILGDGDIADICKLTCLEQGVRVLDHNSGREGYSAASDSPEQSESLSIGVEIPTLEVRGTKVILKM
jgi:DNA-binding MarR family transcriptional regulator